MMTLFNDGAFKAALNNGERFFLVAGPKGSGKTGALLGAVHAAGGSMTLPPNRDADGNPLSLEAQALEGFNTAGLNVAYGVVALLLTEQHFKDMGLQAPKGRAGAVEAFEALSTSLRQNENIRQKQKTRQNVALALLYDDDTFGQPIRYVL